MGKLSHALAGHGLHSLRFAGDQGRRLVARARAPTLGQGLCLAGASFGVLALIGWVIGAQELTRLSDREPPMMPTTALSLSLVGIAGALRHDPASTPRRNLAAALAAFVLAVGAAIFLADLAAARGHLSAGDPGAHPARMAPITALALALLAGSVLLYERRARFACPSEWLAIAAGVLPLTAVFERVFGAGPLYPGEYVSVLPIDVPTAFSLLATSTGLVLEQADRGVMRVMVSSGPGGLLIRRLAPAALVGPILLGLLTARFLAVLGVNDFPLFYAVLAVAAAFVGLALLVAIAGPLDRAHEERVHAEEELRLSEAKFSGIIAISADAIVSTDEEQRIVTFNDGAEKVFGYRKDEVLGAPLDILIPERFRAVHREHMDRFGQEAAMARQATGRPVIGLRKNGEEFPVQGTISWLEVGGRKVFTMTMRDVTEQKRREKEQQLLADIGSALTASLDADVTLRAVAELMVVSFADLCIVDVVEEWGAVRRRAVACRDPETQWACDVVRKHALNETCPQKIALDTRKPLLTKKLTPEMIEAFSPDECFLEAVQALDPKSILAVPLVVGNEPLGVICLVSTDPHHPYEDRDVWLAQEVAQRAALWLESARLYQKARRAIRDRDDVLGVVAHDLRNPLGAILLQTTLLRRSLESRQMPVRPADVIERAATRMSRLIQDLLDVTRIESGHLALERVRLSSGQILHDTFESQQSLVLAASLDLVVDVPEWLPDVWGDHDRLLQVFENLISNAVRFTKPGGTITLGAAVRAEAVQFWVADTGVGIAQENINRMFDRFWQAQKDHRGAGLGLTIVKGIVEAHGGRIWVESEPGKGSTFYFTIPTCEAMERGSESASHARAG